MTQHRKSGLWITLGAVFLIIEFILIQFDMVVLELPDQRIDQLSIWLAVATWVCLLIGVVTLSSSKAYGQKQMTFVVATIGLSFYLLGSIAIFFNFWEIVYVVPVGLLVTSIGLLVVGWFGVSKHINRKWHRFVFMSVGLYPFVCMFPFVAITGVPNYSVNYAWGFLWLFAGSVIFSGRLVRQAVV